MWFDYTVLYICLYIVCILAIRHSDDVTEVTGTCY